MKKKLVRLIFVIAIIGAVVFTVWRWKYGPHDDFSGIGSNNRSIMSSNPSELKRVEKANINYAIGEVPTKPQPDQVFYEDSGFNPQKITAKRGAIITFFSLSKLHPLSLSGPNISNGPVLVQVGKSLSIGFGSVGTFVYTNEGDGQKITVEIN